VVFSNVQFISSLCLIKEKFFSLARTQRKVKYYELKDIKMDLENIYSRNVGILSSIYM
jgi:hypothetical protein